MEVLETDDYLPSIKMAIKVEMIHPTGNIAYEASDIWFECNVWDNFVVSINGIGLSSSGKASLKNISDFFSIEISSENGVITFDLKCEEINICNGTSNLSYRSVIDDDLLSHIKNQFCHFEKWW